MSKMLLWICVGIGGTAGAFLPALWRSESTLQAVFFSTLGSVVGIWFWYRYLRYS